ncbi:hypothetical protein GAPWKB30_0840 [Gilliamella apicola]|nr:hypothetical protein GAPWKB30_0840 [Gilliamella apicola]
MIYGRIKGNGAGIRVVVKALFSLLLGLFHENQNPFCT